MHAPSSHTQGWAQVAMTILIVSTVFIKPHMDPHTVEGGQVFVNYLFYSTYFCLVTAFTELAFSVTPLPASLRACCLLA